MQRQRNSVFAAASRQRWTPSRSPSHLSHRLRLPIPSYSIQSPSRSLFPSSPLLFSFPHRIALFPVLDTQYSSSKTISITRLPFTPPIFFYFTHHLIPQPLASRSCELSHSVRDLSFNQSSISLRILSSLVHHNQFSMPGIKWTTDAEEAYFMSRLTVYGECRGKIGAVNKKMDTFIAKVYADHRVTFPGRMEEWVISKFGLNGAVEERKQTAEGVRNFQ